MFFIYTYVGWVGLLPILIRNCLRISRIKKKKLGDYWHSVTTLSKWHYQNRSLSKWTQIRLHPTSFWCRSWKKEALTRSHFFKPITIALGAGLNSGCTNGATAKQGQLNDYLACGEAFTGIKITKSLQKERVTPARMFRFILLASGLGWYVIC